MINHQSIRNSEELIFNPPQPSGPRFMVVERQPAMAFCRLPFITPDRKTQNIFADEEIRQKINAPRPQKEFQYF